MSREELAEMLMRALMNMDREALRRLAALAVQQFAGMEPGRPVGGTYYLYRTLRALDLEALTERLMGQARQQGEAGEGELADRLLREEFEARLRELRELVEEEIRRALVADRGMEAMARTLRKPLPEDVEFMHASPRRDARAAAGRLPADAIDGGAARATPPAAAPRARSTSARRCGRRCRTAACPRSRSSGTRTRRSPRSW